MWEKTYFHWLENIRDWTVSRQLWWGHRVPAWRCERCGEWTVESEDPARCGSCGAVELQQEVDVLDTWFSSALWPFSTLGWPDDTPELRCFYPTSALSTGFDILFFWVARMIMMGLRLVGDVPFRDVYIHPLLRDAEGKKMSKSRGNVIDPIEVMSAHGTDALRYTLVSLAAQGRDIKLGESQLESGRTFVTKLWNAARFVLLNLQDFDPRAPAAPRSLYDRWIRQRLDEAVAATQRALEAFRFNEAAATLYRFVWGELCDWYIELTKLPLQGDDSEARRASQATLLETLSGALVALHPVMPFLTEEIFQVLPGNDSRLIGRQSYPEPAPALSGEERDEMDALVEVVSRIRQVRGELGLPAGTGLRVTLPCAAREVLATHERALRALTRTDELRFADDEPPATAALAQAGAFLVRVELDDPSRLGDEVRRLEKVLGKLEKDLAFVSKKLENPRFLERAASDVVEAEQEKHARLSDTAKGVRMRLGRLREVVGSKA
jgi:valyl-tRNA synthetase